MEMKGDLRGVGRNWWTWRAMYPWLHFRVIDRVSEYMHCITFGLI